MALGERMLSPSLSVKAPSSGIQIFNASCWCGEMQSAGQCVTSVSRQPSICTSSTGNPCVVESCVTAPRYRLPLGCHTAIRGGDNLLTH